MQKRILSNPKPCQQWKRTGEQGYVLLTLLLAMALLVIAAGVAASSLSFTIRRDREEELIHRGVQYRRAIREFTKRTGRFPIRLEELEQSEGRRFLRRRYKDPITGKDFKLVYMKDVQLGSNQIPQQNVSTTSSSNSASQASLPMAQGDPSDPVQTDPSATQKLSPLPNATAIPASSGGQQIVGGLIVGVVSASKDQSIREFNRKKHYNEWRFYYDTAFDPYFMANAPTERPKLSPIAPPPPPTASASAQLSNTPTVTPPQTSQ